MALFKKVKNIFKKDKIKYKIPDDDVTTGLIKDLLSKGPWGINYRVNEELVKTHSHDISKKTHKDIDYLASIYDLIYILIDIEADHDEEILKNKKLKEEIIERKNVDIILFGAFIHSRFNIDFKHHPLIIKKVREELKTRPESRFFKRKK